MSLVCSSAVAMLGSLKILSSSPMSSIRAEQASSCSESYEAADSGSSGDREMIEPAGASSSGCVVEDGVAARVDSVAGGFASVVGGRRFGKLREIARL